MRPAGEYVDDEETKEIAERANAVAFGFATPQVLDANNCLKLIRKLRKTQAQLIAVARERDVYIYKKTGKSPVKRDPESVKQMFDYLDRSDKRWYDFLASRFPFKK